MAMVLNAKVGLISYVKDNVKAELRSITKPADNNGRKKWEFSKEVKGKYSLEAVAFELEKIQDYAKRYNMDCYNVLSDYVKGYIKL